MEALLQISVSSLQQNIKISNRFAEWNQSVQFTSKISSDELYAVGFN